MKALQEIAGCSRAPGMLRSLSRPDPTTCITCRALAATKLPTSSERKSRGVSTKPCTSLPHEATLGRKMIFWEGNE